MRAPLKKVQLKRVAPPKRKNTEIGFYSSDESEAEQEALHTANILLEFLKGLKNGKEKKDLLVLVSYEGPQEGQVYHELQLKVQTDFIPKKKKYAGFGWLNQVEQAAILIYLNTCVDR